MYDCCAMSLVSMNLCLVFPGRIRMLRDACAICEMFLRRVCNMRNDL